MTKKQLPPPMENQPADSDRKNAAAPMASHPTGKPGGGRAPRSVIVPSKAEPKRRSALAKQRGQMEAAKKRGLRRPYP